MKAHMSWIKKWKVTLFVVFGSFLFAVLASELILRFIFVLPTPIARYYPIAANVIGKPLTFDQYEYQTVNNYNTYGFRDKDFKVKKDRPRILFFGDSFLEGQGVDEVARFSNLACQRFDQKIECINFGQIATNPNNYFDNLIDFGMALQPDMIVLSIFLGNDFMQMGLNQLPNSYQIKSQDDLLKDITRSKPYLLLLIEQLITKKKILYKNENYDKKNFWELIIGKKVDRNFYLKNSNVEEEKYESYTKNINPKLLQAIYDGKLGSTFLGEVLNQANTSVDSKQYYSESDYESMLNYLIEINKITKNEKVKLLILLIPDMSEVNQSEFVSVLKNDFAIKLWPKRLDELSQMHQRLIADLHKRNIPYLDLLDRLKATNETLYYKYDNHFNGVGHKVVGELLRVNLSEALQGEVQ